LIASFFTIGLMTLVGNLQPYLFNAVLHVPFSEQGRLGGNLASLNEIMFLIVASVVGAASDKVGRRSIYALGFVVMALAYVLYPLATDPAHLYATRILFAVGAACVSAMIAAIIADYATESARGKLVGICFFSERHRRCDARGVRRSFAEVGRIFGCRSGVGGALLVLDHRRRLSRADVRRRLRPASRRTRAPRPQRAPARHPARRSRCCSRS
jgi:MFS family permease